MGSLGTGAFVRPSRSGTVRQVVQAADRGVVVPLRSDVNLTRQQHTRSDRRNQAPMEGQRFKNS